MTYVQYKSGTLVDLDKIGVRTVDFVVHAPTPRHTWESVEMGYGDVDMGSSIGPRDITVIFRSAAYDYDDFGLQRDEIFNLFRSDRAFYLIEKRNPGKRWLVKTKSPYTIDQRYVYGDFQVEFNAFLGLAESRETTATPFEWDVNTWQWGMGIPYDDYFYEHYSNQFMIYNAGTELVNPRNPYMYLKIEIQAETSDYIEIQNHTTGDTYRYTGNLTDNDSLVIEGIRSTVNGLSVFRDTNKRLISLAPGENEIEIKGADLERAFFDFRFYYV